jgi:hypothetical protein
MAGVGGLPADRVRAYWRVDRGAAASHKRLGFAAQLSTNMLAPAVRGVTTSVFSLIVAGQQTRGHVGRASDSAGAAELVVR